MPAKKDLKRLVRSRMQKTGESYTTARRLIVARRTPRAAPPAAAATPPPAAPDYEAITGVRDATVVAKTGRSWREWCELLDAEGAATKSHRDIAASLHERHGVSGWWSQTLTGGYERVRGRRDKHQMPDGFAIGKSRTLVAPFDRVLAAFAPSARAEWLGDAATTARRSSRRDVLRWRDADGTFVDVYLVAKAASKTTVTVQLGRLPSRAAAEERRDRWAQHLQSLGDWLAAH